MKLKPERRYLHVAVCLEHYILVLGGNRCETIKMLTYDVHTALPANVIWMYNIYTGQWRKHTIPYTEKAPYAIRGGSAVTVESVVYVYFRKLESNSDRVTNALWKLNRNSEGCFAWDDIVTTEIMKVPSPRSSCTAWNYSEKLWLFGGYGAPPTGYLNDHGDFLDDENNQLLCFNPSCNEWTNPKCAGTVPAPCSHHATAIHKNIVWLYGGRNGTNVYFNDLYQLNMHCLTWTNIQISHPKPSELACCSLNITSCNQLVLHGGAYRSGYRLHTSSDTWILDLPTQTWRLYKSTKDHPRDNHTGTTGLNGCAIIIGGFRRVGYDDYTTTFHVMLHPKSLQQLAIQCVFQYKN